MTKRQGVLGVSVGVGVPLRILHVEDYEDDSLLLTRHLTRAGYRVSIQRVETAAALADALEQRQWDVAVTDYVLPGFSAAAAQALIRSKAPQLPVILLSGAVGEEAAGLAAMQAGIRDHILKNSLARFVHAIPLAAGVVPQLQRASLHLNLGMAYTQAAEPDLARGMLHFQEALRTAEQDGDRASALIAMAYCHVKMEQYDQALDLLKRYAAVRRHLAPDEKALNGGVLYALALTLTGRGKPDRARRALLRAEEYFRRKGKSQRAAECRQLLLALTEAEQDGAEWVGCLERGRYQLIMGDSGQAWAEGTRALDLAGKDPVRSYHCCMFLLACAQQDGDGTRALAYAIAARVAAMEGGRLDLAYAATESLGEVTRSLGSDVSAALEWVEQRWRCENADLWQYIPFNLRGVPDPESDG